MNSQPQLEIWKQELAVLRDRAQKLSLRKLKFQKENPAKRYIPNGKIEEFVKLVGKNETFVCLISAANGVGKTTAGSNIIANICYGPQSQYFKHPLFEKFPYPKQGRIISDPRTVEQTIAGGQKELELWMPKGRYVTTKAGRNFDANWVTDTGFSFDVMTFEQDPKEFESKTLGWAWFDEPPPKAIFDATVARMRRGGIIFITMTPLAGSAWLYDHFISGAKEGQRGYIEADIEANCRQHGIRGILEHAHIEKMISEYSDDEKQARIKGKFQHLIGRVFKKFERRIHVIKPFNIDYQRFCVYNHYDVHDRLPDAVLWLAVNAAGDFFVIDELFEPGTYEEIGSWMLAKESGRYRVVSRVMDPKGFIPNKGEKNERALNQVYEEDMNITFMPASKQRTTGIKLIEQAINFQEISGQLIVKPKLYVFDTCVNTIREFEQLIWQEHRGRGSDQKDPNPKTVDKDDHFVPEGLYRILIQDPRFEYYEEDAENEEVLYNREQGY